MNNNGVLAGRVYASGESGGYCFRWDRAAGMRQIAPQSTLWDNASGINDQGTIVGWSGLKAWIWDQAQGLRYLPMPPGLSWYSNAYDVNEANQVTGIAGPSGNYSGTIPGSRAVVWEEGKPPKVIPPLPGANHGYGSVISEEGEVYGGQHGFGAFFHWNPLTNFTTQVTPPWPKQAETMGGCRAPFMVAGHGGVNQPCTYDAENGTRYFGPAGVSGMATDVNAHGLVIGVRYSPTRAVIWHEGSMTDLTNLVAEPGWVLQYAWETNNDGWIAGFGTFNGTPHGFLLTPSNRPPSVDPGGPYAVAEGDEIALAATGSDPDGDSLSYAWDLDADGLYETPGQSVLFSALGLDGPSSVTISCKATDAHGASATGSTAVHITNVAPQIGAISGPAQPVAINTGISFAADFTDPGLPDTHSALWDWGDGTTSPGSVAFLNGTGAVSGDHAYASPGIFTVTLTVTDDDLGTDSSAYRYAVICDPDGGFLTAGGWISSPRGAFAADPLWTGKANFGLNCKYQKGASVPTGETEFRIPRLNFHSTECRWLVVSGAMAKYQGIGKINGTGEFGFMVTAIDGDMPGKARGDQFRIKIWDVATGAVAYDNQPGAEDDSSAATTLGGGSVVVHTGGAAHKQTPSGRVTTAAAIPTGQGAQIVYTLSADAAVSIDVMNIAGRLVGRVCADTPATAGANTSVWNGRSATGTSVPNGRYLVRITARAEDGSQSQVITSMTRGR